MKKLIMPLVVSSFLLLNSSFSFAVPTSGQASFDRSDTIQSVLSEGTYSSNSIVGTKYAYWHRGHHYRWHRGYPYHRYHRWHRHHWRRW